MMGKYMGFLEGVLDTAAVLSTRRNLTDMDGASVHKSLSTAGYELASLRASICDLESGGAVPDCLRVLKELCNGMEVAVLCTAQAIAGGAITGRAGDGLLLAMIHSLNSWAAESESELEKADSGAGVRRVAS